MPQNVTGNPIPKLTLDFELDLDSWSHPPFLLTMKSNYIKEPKNYGFSAIKIEFGLWLDFEMGFDGSVVTF